MTGRVAKIQVGLKQTLKLRGYGGLRTKEEVRPIQEFRKPFAMAVWFDSPASGAEKSNPLLITKTTTSLLMSCGFASHATNNDTRS